MLPTLLLLLACGPKEAPPEVLTPPDVVNTPDTTGSTQAPEPSLPEPSTPAGPPGTPLDSERLDRLMGAWVDQNGQLLKILGPDSAEVAGRPVSMMALFCDWGAQRVPCMGLEATPLVPGTSRLLILAQDAQGRLVQVDVGPYYVVQAPVAKGQSFSSLATKGKGSAVPKDQRLILGVGGTPLFCTSEGAASTQCAGYYNSVELLPLYSPVLERSQVTLVSSGGVKGCDSGVRVSETLSAKGERSLNLTITPVLPREDDLAKITRALRAAPGDVRSAWRVDLDQDRREDLLFEVAVPVGAGGQPARAAVGVLSGDQVVILSERQAVNALAPAPLLRVAGLVDPFGDGALAVLVSAEADKAQGWDLLRYSASGPIKVYGLSC